MLCEWFATCARPATWLVRHPILNRVPTCDKCADWLRRNGAPDSDFQRVD